jgi:hypothetical protein
MPVNDIRAALELIEPTDTGAHQKLTEAEAIYEDESQRDRTRQLLAEAQRELEASGANDATVRHIDKALKDLRR